MFTTTAEFVTQIPHGKCLGLRTNTNFVEVGRAPSGAYFAGCGIEVEEAHDDDYLSFPPFPFRDRRAKPWIGYRFETPSPAVALEVANSWHDEIAAGKDPTPRGKTVGSVRR